MAKFANQFQMPEPNVEVPLYRGPITLTVGDQSVTHDGLIKLCWLPNLRVRFRLSEIPVEVTRQNTSVWLEGSPHLSIPGVPNKVATLITNAHFGSRRPLTLEGMLTDGLEVGTGEGIAFAQYQIANLEDYYVKGPENRLHLETHEWKITVEPVPGLADLNKKLKHAGGYVITHQATVTRRNDQTFAPDDVRFLGYSPFTFLSFLQGRKVNAILPVGYDASGTSVWQEWGPWMVDRWQSVFNWADLHHPEHFGQAFSGFMDLWHDEGWREVLRTAIHWYVEANRNASGLEAGVVFLQMALELLAWHYLVEHRKAMTKKRFNLRRAADRMRLLLSQHGIPMEIPDTLPCLARCAKKSKLIDVADALPQVRNMIVHPQPNRRTRLRCSHKSLLQETWTCGLWLVEMLLLRLFKYSGQYSDRRDPVKYVGHAAPVPWSQ